MEQGKNRFSCAACRISIRFSSPIFVPEFPSFLERLEAKGYAQTGQLKPPTPPNMLNFSIEVADQIATKGNIIVDLDTNKQYLGVQSMKTDQVIQPYSEVKELFFADNGKLVNKIWFYEFQASHRYSSISSAIKGISKSAGDMKLIPEISKIMGQKISVRGITLSSFNADPNTEEYIDLNINPDLNDSSFYNVITIYRNKDEKNVLKFAENSTENLKSILETIDES